MIRDTEVPLFLQRSTDKVFSGRNRTRIVLGTDRKEEITTGYGQGGQNDPESGTIDLVAGYKDQNPSFLQDSSRVYISGKTDPDDDLNISAGEKVVGEPTNIIVSDNNYIRSRNKTKIVGEGYNILLSPEEMEINVESTIDIKCGDASIKFEDGGKRINISSGDASIILARNGEISLGTALGPRGRIITENDICSGPVKGGGGGTATCSFKTPESLINNQKVYTRG